MGRIMRTLMGLLVVMSGATAFAQTMSDQSGTEKLPRFAVTLALGDVNSAAPAPARAAPPFSPAASRALADMKDFLPYKSYVPLDTVYLIGLGGPQQQLSGIGGKHTFHMRGLQMSPTHMKIELLRLWAAPDAEGKPGGVIIDTSFTIEMGETVVVGTSRLDGNRALILLVTAAK